MEKMKIYEVDGRKVWLRTAPAGYEAPKKAEPAKAEPKEEPKAEIETKAKKTPANKARKAGANK